ncbi:alcohol dehydrogenase catalytic domain-containing protein [Candidatus Poribacteria bacterium]|jgi:erythritol/L-threitol dehydrogenase|nr:alcohol dehydrogenase catalytic domain-containing protein [Candidatus Poribacteria bacterium]MBT5533298.1 alcohol dehydrogenase catalytic domain-containing protein [Candidatus Poribacteria bacterium]MBT5710521.1 alcohol dehydrogenase catalytic domain-containing protein [Candidatus Poribacteria bacterium]MBT7805253.1 alcohol dehydrogenase catalytic domain-containing protein [Candidatus Poribacteria bacterium]
MQPAVMCHGPFDYRWEDVPVPTAGPGEVVIDVGACGVCASDVKCYSGAPLFWGDDDREGYVQGPVIPGHEFVGTVAELGEGAAERFGLAIGDTAISEQIVPCGACRYCDRGQYWMCQVHDIYGFRRSVHGGWAPRMKFPSNARVYKVPADVPMWQAALIEPLACSIHAVERGEIELGDVVVIAGAGTLGLGMVAAARLKSPASLVVLDMNDDRLDVARALGADVTLNPGREDALQAVLDMTEGYGCDVYIEATGHPDAVKQGLFMIRKLGTFVEFSVMREPVTVDWTIIGDTKELNIHGSHLGPYCYPIAIDMIAKGRIDVAQVVTHRLPLEDYAEAIELVRAGSESIKVLLEPSR